MKIIKVRGEFNPRQYETLSVFLHKQKPLEIVAARHATFHGNLTEELEEKGHELVKNLENREMYEEYRCAYNPAEGRNPGKPHRYREKGIVIPYHLPEELLKKIALAIKSLYRPETRVWTYGERSKIKKAGTLEELSRK